MSTTDSFMAELCAEADNVTLHHACLAHPFVLGIGRGDLPEAAFRGYLAQDYLFLCAYVRVLARGVAASPTLADATLLSELLHATLTTEIAALRDLYAAFAGDPASLDTTTLHPTARAYIDHLLATSAEHSLPLILASILPCQWGYREIGRQLAAQGLPADTRYAHWISEYASDAYGALVDQLIDRFDSLADAAGAHNRERCHTVFAASTMYEHAFWEMARNQ